MLGVNTGGDKKAEILDIDEFISALEAVKQDSVAEPSLLNVPKTQKSRKLSLETILNRGSTVSAPPSNEIPKKLTTPIDRGEQFSANFGDDDSNDHHSENIV